MKPLKERIEIEQAFLDGKEVHWKFFEDWHLLEPENKDEYVFQWDKINYRIKPEPMVFFMNVYMEDGLSTHLYKSKEEADKQAGSRRIRVARFIEDLEGD